MTTGNDRIVVQNRIDFVTGAVRRYLPDADALTEIAGKVQALAESHDAASLRNEPGEGEWSALRTLGHMIAYARVLHDQLDRMAYMTDPVLPLTNDAAVAEREGWESRAPAELAALFNDAIGEAVELLKHVPDSSWGPGRPAPAGRTPLDRAARARRRRAPAQPHRADRGGARRGVAEGAPRPSVPGQPLVKRLRNGAQRASCTRRACSGSLSPRCRAATPHPRPLPQGARSRTTLETKGLQRSPLEEREPGPGAERRNEAPRALAAR